MATSCLCSAPALQQQQVDDGEASNFPIPDPSPDGGLQLCFLGTGTSSGNPHLNCLLGLTKSKRRGGCSVCKRAAQGDPARNRNYRGNPSLLLRYRENEQAPVKHIQIDAGKTFRESALRWYQRFNVPSLDALVLTHEHADATLGIDDLRMVHHRGSTIDVYLSKQCYNQVQNVFPYLVRSAPIDLTICEMLPTKVVTESASGGNKSSETETENTPVDGTTAQVRPSSCEKYGLIKSEMPQVEGLQKANTFVAAIRWKLLSGPSVDDPFKPVNVAGLPMTPLPVWHGDNYLSLGFLFGSRDCQVAYLSDISDFPPRTLEYLKSVSLKYLVIDCLHRTHHYPTHMSLPEAVDTIKLLRPENVLLVGVSHDFEHHEFNDELTKLSLELAEFGCKSIQAAWDGLVVSLD